MHAAIVLLILILTYIGMAAGRIAWLQVDRTGIALLAVIALLASGEMTIDDFGSAVDLPTLARCRPGDPLRFVSVEFGAAEEMCRDAEREFAKLVAAIEPAPSDNGLDIGLLYGENLISGVTAGFE